MIIHKIDQKNTNINIKQQKLNFIIIVIETFPNYTLSNLFEVVDELLLYVYNILFVGMQ